MNDRDVQDNATPSRYPNVRDTAAHYADLPLPPEEMPSLISGVDQLQYRIEVLTYAETYQRTHDVATISNYVLRCVEGAYIGAALDTLLELRGEDARNVLDMLQAWLDQLPVTHPRLRSTKHLIIKIALASSELPRQLFLTGITYPRMPSPFGGAMGDMYFGTYEGLDVAIKRVRHPSIVNRRSTAKYYRRQCLVWRGLDHPNVLTFLGLFKFTEQHDDLSLVSPRLAHNMTDYVVPALGKFDGARDRQRLLCDIAEGLCYLHSNFVVHGDIKPHNILISESGSALVADFDLIVLADSSLGRQTTDSGNRATDAFKAPERFNGQRRPTQECDVYAFACLCVTASTGCKPLYDTAKKDVWQLVGVEDKRPERPLASACMGPPISDDLWQLIESCWKTKPEERLTMQEVVAYFQRNMPP